MRVNAPYKISPNTPHEIPYTIKNPHNVSEKADKIKYYIKINNV